MILSPLEVSTLHIHHDTPAAYEVEGYVGSWQEESPFEKAAPPSCRSFLPLFHILPYRLPSIYLITYLPVSFMCILSMTIGYLSLRYIELSISSPILFPILYSIIAGLGTFFDAIYLDELQLIGEDQALLAYEFTFFLCALLLLLYLRITKEPFSLLKENDQGLADGFETLGQFFYVYAMARNAIITTPFIASYSVFSVLLSRIFLKEKLNKPQYASIITVLSGILLLALSEVL